MQPYSYKKNTASASGNLPVEKELLRITNRITILPKTGTPSLLAAGAGSRVQKLRPQPTPAPAPTEQPSPLEVYTAYTLDDERFFIKINEQLDILRRQGWPISCHAHEIAYSTVWQNSDHLETANLILLLVSTSFLNTDFCYCDLIYLAVQRQRKNPLCCVIPIILYELHPLLLERTPFGKLDFLPRNGRPISSWSNSRKAYADITGYLIEKIQRMAYYRQI